MNTKKAQTALEFLMTYAWAFLIIIAGLGAFLYVQISAKDLINPSCTFTNGIECHNFLITETEIMLELKNNVGRNINITRMTCTVYSDEQNAIGLPIILTPGEISNPPINCTQTSGESINELLRVDVLVYYIPEGFEFERTTQGQVLGIIS